MKVLFAGSEADWADYQDILPSALADVGIEAEISRDFTPGDPASVDYIIYAPDGALTDFSPFTGAKLVMNLWAGVESVVTNATLTQPLTRMVDPGLTEGMIEWCVSHTLRHHLGHDRDVCRRDAVWDYYVPKLARERRVTILGLGALGAAVGQALAALNFDVTGWSRSQKDVAGLSCLAGDVGLAEALGQAEILILLLPLTAATENLMNAARLGALPKGAVLINPGRGPLIDDDALIVALDDRHLAHATLDVFREEPLPGDHPFWAHPHVTVTPHVASATRASSAVRVLAENIRRGEAGEPFLNLVDRERGY